MRSDCRQSELSGLGEEGVPPHGLYGELEPGEDHTLGHRS